MLWGTRLLSQNHVTCKTPHTSGEQSEVWHTERREASQEGIFPFHSLVTKIYSLTPETQMHETSQIKLQKQNSEHSGVLKTLYWDHVQAQLCHWHVTLGKSFSFSRSALLPLRYDVPFLF